jgi:exosortase/archaeosortase family protein
MNPNNPILKIASIKHIQKYRQTLIFFVRLFVLTFPVFILFIALRSDPAIRDWASEKFPVWHLSKFLMVGAQKVLALFGFVSTVFFSHEFYHYGVFALQIEGGNAVFIGFSCLGIGLVWLYSSLIIAPSGPWKWKLVFVIAGILLIQLMNILRFSFLAWLLRDQSMIAFKTYRIDGLLTFNHHDIFNFVIYVVIFIIFIIWMEFLKKHKKSYPDS